LLKKRNFNIFEADVSIIASISADVLKSAQQQIQQDLTQALDAFALPEPLKGAVYHAVMLGEACTTCTLLCNCGIATT
jgi:hypothetical protein